MPVGKEGFEKRRYGKIIQIKQEKISPCVKNGFWSFKKMPNEPKS